MQPGSWYTVVCVIVCMYSVYIYIHMYSCSYMHVFVFCIKLQSFFGANIKVLLVLPSLACSVLVIYKFSSLFILWLLITTGLFWQGSGMAEEAL